MVTPCGVTLSSSCLPSGVLSSIGKIFKEEGLLGFFVYVSLFPVTATNRCVLSPLGRSCRPGLTTGACPRVSRRQLCYFGNNVGGRATQPLQAPA